MPDAGDMYKKLKKQNGEKFAQTLRNFHNGIFEIPELDLILRHAGREAEPLLPYLMGLLAANDNKNDNTPEATLSPFDLLDRAGYDAFHADTLEKQNSIKKHFAPDELLCTFNDSARYEKYHIIHAVKKNVDEIKRENFKGREEREDAYGTSVISIQMLKTGGFIKITNRYNHTVSACDNTFDSNPDNIVPGLSSALKEHLNVDFSVTKNALPNGCVLIGDRVFKSHEERNGIYYGDQAWAKDGEIHEIDRVAHDALFDEFLFDNESKTLTSIDTDSEDSFAADFNRFYGGNPGLNVDKAGNLVLNGQVLIGAEKSRIKTLCLPAFTEMSDNCLRFGARALIQFEASTLVRMGDDCLRNAYDLTHFAAAALTTAGSGCFDNAYDMTYFHVPLLTSGREWLPYSQWEFSL